jgi:hypothetical protein
MSDPQCPGLRSLYHAAKLRQLRAIAGDPNSSPQRVTQATDEIRKLADSLYQDREAGPAALIARLEREGIDAVERTLAGRTDAPADPVTGYVYDIRFPAKPALGVVRARVLNVATGARAVGGRRVALLEVMLGRLPKAGTSAGAGPCDSGTFPIARTAEGQDIEVGPAGHVEPRA